MPIGQLYVFFVKMSIWVFCPFFNWVVGRVVVIGLNKLVVYFGK